MLALWIFDWAFFFFLALDEPGKAQVEIHYFEPHINVCSDLFVILCSNESYILTFVVVDPLYLSQSRGVEAEQRTDHFIRGEKKVGDFNLLARLGSLLFH